MIPKQYRVYAVMYFIAEHIGSNEYKVFRLAWCSIDQPIKRKHMKRLYKMVQDTVGEDWEVNPCTSTTYRKTPQWLQQDLDSRVIDECLRGNQNGKN